MTVLASSSIMLAPSSRVKMAEGLKPKSQRPCNGNDTSSCSRDIAFARNTNEEEIMKSEKWVQRLHEIEEERKWVTFDCRIDDPKRNLERWLFLNNPERTDGEKDNVAWITIRGCQYDEEENGHPDLDGLDKEWEKLTGGESADNRLSRSNFQLFADLGRKYNVLSGKWLVWPPRDATEDIWNKICRDIASGGKLPQAGCFTAKVSPVVEEKKGHVICIYNSDFTNKSQVLAVEKAFRSIIERAINLTYKPDLFTYCDVYGKNKFHIPPYIYKSRWDKEMGDFCVTPAYHDA